MKFYDKAGAMRCLKLKKKKVNHLVGMTKIL